MIDSTQTAIELAADIPETAASVILHRAANLYGTQAGEQAGDRDFGLNWDAVDMPIETAKALMAAEIITKTKKYIAGCKAQSVAWTVNPENGALSAKVVIGIE